ncbi:MRG-domain-containing protein [Chaetomium sp. MPI-CAGE-AT-0009]|nr:MRG-domain-containing protein [Chaetomium sp. MPI-CAGE-AT-0009]
MAPQKQQQPPFQKDERVLCFHMEMLYEAKILDVMAAENGEGWLYKIHYKGWKSSWDDWVPQDRVRKFTDENKDLASQLVAQFKMLQSGKAAKQTTKKGGATARAANGSDMSSARGSEERTAATTTSGRGPRRARDYELEQEDNFHHRPSIKIPVPDHLKSMLVDDWENVTKNQQLVPLPHPHPVEEILNDYLAYEKPNRQEGSASLDILEEAIAGLREYFDKSLGRILLYRFERVQYHEMHKLWSQADGKNKSAVDTYGAEHLSRLLVSLPELIAQTNMDQQSVNRLREELMKFINWFSRHVVKYFVSQYETPGAGYVQQVDSA